MKIKNDVFVQLCSDHNTTLDRHSNITVSATISVERRNFRFKKVDFDFRSGKRDFQKQYLR